MKLLHLTDTRKNERLIDSNMHQEYQSGATGQNQPIATITSLHANQTYHAFTDNTTTRVTAGRLQASRADIGLLDWSLVGAQL